MINIAAPILEDDEIQAVKGVLLSGMLAQGPKVKTFEEVFASYIGTKYAVATTECNIVYDTAINTTDIMRLTAFC